MAKNSYYMNNYEKVEAAFFRIYFKRGNCYGSQTKNQTIDYLKTKTSYLLIALASARH